MYQATKITESSFEADSLFSERIRNVPRSFIREILKVAVSKDVISFAGGLPNAELFPMHDLKNASARVFEEFGPSSLQYSNTEGFYLLREYISAYYKARHGLDVAPEEILITTGSQQGLDLLGKVLINQGDKLLIESPGYLGAIQAFSVFQAGFEPIPLLNDGIDTKAMEQCLEKNDIKLFYTVPQFQNPSGISYSAQVREEAAQILRKNRTLIVEDNPYIDLYFETKPSKSFFHYLPEQTVLLGTFSKIAVPGFRVGWIVAKGSLMDKLIVAKQAADLHTNIFTQMLLYTYLRDNSIDKHIAKITKAYSSQCEAMVEAIQKEMPAGISFTRPRGGMFLWLSLPNGQSSMELFEKSIARKVAFVPGNPFYTTAKRDYPTLRLNFSCASEQQIQEGIARIAEAYSEIN